MDKADEIGIPISRVGVRRQAHSSIAIIGNPNSGKSTLFNRLTGLRQTTGNYPGVTVEKHIGTIQLQNSALRLVDLPGIYCLGGHSADERIAVDVLLGRLDPADKPSGLLVVLDATHLYQGLYLLEQLLELLQRDPAFDNGVAKRGMSAILNMLGEDNEIAREYRKQMLSLIH